ncbi:MAG: PEP-CTERM sorting domain-containing protein [Okeania sp. SIO2G4]|uniref:PEP-CTERM sorting domain-containing protein n=1 Tax=unclassified Okeania TaxID=2634635 RepID=UPI0013BAA7E6|nr:MULTISPECIES: PEP-CTERM sorting domain-containing protein [unclassified Okeania]NEP03946.1 PEP-CTERM sorting domain-containing protein [Okeania sp. SIO4D6]NEP44362.1 PEP-CTERM sorting domain-containing protein [Okeania sp. SIO2H7]NEP73894.1 PEP-CTERM sorting domain-containing protein [Okeania sp. SIO2G5]NEP94707.1 PEP-CTERM sorting domain-containing protein [Okeania sp. SIO2F5]NEQ92432.1 PEP-CTERM sorting domain-containing protein [Okeania sp. SIO2G4]
MFKHFSIAAVGAAITTFTAVSAASAATFGFSFSNVNGAVNGTVEGTIELIESPVRDDRFLATSVIVTSSPDLGYNLPLNIFTDINQPSANTFIVVGGEIDGLLFNSNNETEGLFLNLIPVITPTGPELIGAALLSSAGARDPFSGVADIGASTVTFTSLSTTIPETVPEPGTILGLLTVGSLGALTRKREA